MDIRTELNKLNKATLKDLVVRHDLHYYIRKTGSKAELVEGLARVYEHLKGIHIFAKPHKLQIMPRFSKQQKERAKRAREKKKAEAEKAKADAEMQMRAKEKARSALSALVAKQKAEKEAKAKEEVKKLTFGELTKEQQKQAEKLIKARTIRKKEAKEMRKAMAKDLAIVNQTIDEVDNGNKHIEELAKILGKNPKELAKEMNVEYRPMKEEKKPEKFSYNSDFVFNPSQEQMKLMAGNQAKFDFYQTPPDVIQQIHNDLFAYSQSYFNYNGMNALEPSAGNGALLSLLIDNQDYLKLANIDAIEFDENMAKLLKENFKISHIYKDNFFTFRQERPYDLILMNPPYEGLVGTNADNRFNSKVAYLYHLARAILLKSSSGTMKTIYAVIPQLKGVSWPDKFPSNVYYEFEDVVNKADMKRMEQIFNMPFDDFPRTIIYRIGTSDKFEKIVYSRGKFNKKPLGMNVDIYKLIVY